ncbi:MAG: CPBP family intramembrane metalloprotease [Clostridia bacterium]|nr:CPBP family intramembrane metalloprotease [Clostridia bacterium]
MNQNEQYYRRVIGAIGASLLFFLLFINVFGAVVEFSSLFLSIFPLGETAITVVYQLLYAIGYLLSFMMPVLILKAFLKKKEIPYRPMRTELKLTPWIALIVPAGASLVLAMAYVNASFVSIFHYSEFSSVVLWGTSTEKPELYHWVLEFITLCLVPGFCEEFLFRGAILTNCLPFGRTNAILISSFLFAMMHQNAEQVLYTFVAGIVLGIVYVKTGNLWACTVLHVLNNFSSLHQSVVLYQFETMFSANIAMVILEILLLLLGVISMAILVVRFFSKKPCLEDGFFGRSLEASDGYAEYPIERGRAVKLFCTPCMIVFLSLSLAQILLLILAAVLYV